MTSPRRVLLVAAAAVTALVLGLPFATAAPTLIEADDPVALSVAVSQAVVPGGGAETLLLADPAAGADLFGVPAALGALPRHAALLLTDSDDLDDGVAGEVRRTTGAPAYEGATAYVPGDVDAVVGEALRSRGIVTVPAAGDTPAALATSLATATYGTPAGTSARIILVTDDADAWPAAAVAAAYGTAVGVPVVPVGERTPQIDAVLDEVIVVASPDAVPDGVAGDLPGAPAMTRVWDEDPAALSLLVADLLGEEAGEGEPHDPVGLAPVVADGYGEDPEPALLASSVVARRTLDGYRSPLLLVNGRAASDAAAACGGSTPDAGVHCRIAEAGGPVTVLALSGTARPGGAGDDGSTPAAAPDAGAGADLPVTGAGLAIAGLLALSAAVAGRRRRLTG